MRKFYTFLTGIFLLSCLVGFTNAAFGFSQEAAANVLVQENDTLAPVALDFQIEYIDHVHNDSVNVIFTIMYSEEIQLVDPFTIVTHYYNNGTWTQYNVYGKSEVAVEENVLTITPNRAFLFTGRYELKVILSAVTDMTGNRAPAVTRTFVADLGGPYVEDFDIDLTFNEVNDSVSAVFSLTYNENVRLADGFIIVSHIFSNGAWVEYDVYDSSEVTVQGNVVTITPTRMFSSTVRYELIVAFGAVTDLVGNMATSFTRVFIADVNPPEVINFNVLFNDSESTDSISASFILTYNEDVQLYRNFFITTHVKEPQGWVTYERIADTGIVVSGKTVTINTNKLYYRDRRFELVVAVGAFLDLAGNRAPAFTKVFLRDSISPRLTDVQPGLSSPVPVNTPFEFRFDEKVRLDNNFGFYTYQWDSVQTGFIEYERLDASQAKVNGNVITFTPSRGFLPNYRVQIILTAGSVMDIEGNRFVNVTEGDSLSYVSKRFWTSDREIIYIMFTPSDGDSLFSIPDELTIAFSGKITLSDTVAADNISLDSVVYLRHNGTGLDHQATLDTITNVITIVPAVKLNFGNTYTFGFNTGLFDAVGEPIPSREATFILVDTVNHVAITDIHGETIVSPLLGQVVRITGTVTGIYPGEGFFVQDDNAVRSGIWIKYTEPMAIEIGKGVSVTGNVDEQHDMAVLVAESVTLTGTQVAIEPIVIQFGTHSIPMYQGVLVKIVNARGTAANQQGEWMLFAGEDADSVVISSQMYAYSPVANNSYDLTGIVTSRQRIYRIEPRIENDVVDVTIPTNVDITPGIAFNIYPNPFGSYVRISNNDKISRAVIANINGQRVMDISYPASEINTSHLVSGVYVISVFNEKNLVKTGRIVKQ